MIEKLIAWAITALILFQNLFICDPAKATALQTAQATAALTQSNDESTKILTFSNTETFYKELANALTSKSSITIKTPSIAMMSFHLN